MHEKDADVPDVADSEGALLRICHLTVLFVSVDSIITAKESRNRKLFAAMY